MIRGETFLVFGDDFGVYPTTTEHVLRRFLPDNDFLWVHLPGLRTPELTLYDLRRVAQKASHWVRRSRQPRFTHPALYSPFILPFNSNRLIRWSNRRRVILGVQKHLRRLGYDRPILVTSLPNTADLLGAFEERLVVYLCEDEYAEMPGANRAYVRDVEHKLLDRADLILVTSKALLAGKAYPGKETVLLSQGVDFDHFHLMRDLSPIPDGLQPIPGPIVGFVGLLASWIDTEALLETARACRDASLVLIGPTRVDVGVLKGEPNVFLLGPRSYGEVPRYMVHFDVGLIPFRLNELTKYVNPLKLLEYFASGMPVVSTALPDVDQYGDLVLVAESATGFAEQVRAALKEESLDRKQRRIEVARDASWERRAEQMSTLLRARLAVRP